MSGSRALTGRAWSCRNPSGRHASFDHQRRLCSSPLAPESLHQGLNFMRFATERIALIIRKREARCTEIRGEAKNRSEPILPRSNGLMPQADADQSKRNASESWGRTRTYRINFRVKPRRRNPDTDVRISSAKTIRTHSALRNNNAIMTASNIGSSRLWFLFSERIALLLGS